MVEPEIDYIAMAAMVAHAAIMQINAAIATGTGAGSIQVGKPVTWAYMTEEDREMRYQGVINAGKQDMTPDKMHNLWVYAMIDQGWTWGPVKDYAKQHHPCMKPWVELTEQEKLKDVVFLAICKAFYATIGGMR